MHHGTQDENVSTAYRPPERKEQLSVRISARTIAKLAAVIRIWKAQAEARGDAAEDVDRTFVVDALLAKIVDEELGQWGGFPTSDEQWKQVLRAVKEANKQ